MEIFRPKVVKLLQCEASCEALLSNVKLQTYQKDKVYCRTAERLQQWCYVLDGLVAAFQHFDNSPPYMHWATLPGQTFTGTKHEYSDSSQELDIRFLKDTSLAVIQLPTLHILMEKHPPILRLINILRQRRYTIADIKLRVVAQSSSNRYRELLLQLPIIPATLNNSQLAKYLNIDPKTLYRSRKIELKRK